MEANSNFDPFLVKFNSSELEIASEFLSNWLPFLSRNLCRRCTRTLSTRIRSLQPESNSDLAVSRERENGSGLTPSKSDDNQWDEERDIRDTNSGGSCKDCENSNDKDDTNSLGSWKDAEDDMQGEVAEASASDTFGSSVKREGTNVKLSWADMAQEEDELEVEEESEVSSHGVKENGSSVDQFEVKEDKPKTQLSRDQREELRFFNVERKKDFICFERVNGKFTNILDGLELHSGVFSAAEQKRIVNFVEELQEKGKNGQLKACTYTAPQNWMRGKGRVTLQFGCCYSYAMDKNGNPPGILKNEAVDPLPQLFKTMIKRLVRWHVMPPTCVPDSCIVNIYYEGDCIPPHIDNHEFVRPFCTVSFLSECSIVFGTNLKVGEPGVFAGSIAIPLPVGSVLVLNGNGADVAKHCVPSVPTKRISITFRRMDESKRPIGFVPEPDLEGLQPLSYDANKSRKSSSSNTRHSSRNQMHRRNEHGENGKWSTDGNIGTRGSVQYRRGSANRRRVMVNLGN
ncbi:hypothetical protein Leryth_007002 [Lithospermum erythrorhizon]|nr:hypothetical protein Leryth_007002 [Lithospermum erythrorhizon]